MEAVELKVRILFEHRVEEDEVWKLVREITRRIENLKVEGIREIVVTKKCFGLEIEP